MLIVGNVSAWEMEGRVLPDASQFSYAQIADITPELISGVKPDIVLSSVFTPEFDVLDLAEALCNSGYHGRYRALAPKLPNPGLVRREVEAICEKIDFDILVIDEMKSLRQH